MLATSTPHFVTPHLVTSHLVTPHLVTPFVDSRCVMMEGSVIRVYHRPLTPGHGSWGCNHVRTQKSWSAIAPCPRVVGGLDGSIVNQSLPELSDLSNAHKCVISALCEIIISQIKNLSCFYNRVYHVFKTEFTIRLTQNLSCI